MARDFSKRQAWATMEPVFEGNPDLERSALGWQEYFSKRSW